MATGKETTYLSDDRRIDLGEDVLLDRVEKLVHHVE
jgi:hypothetical protein